MKKAKERLEVCITIGKEFAIIYDDLIVFINIGYDADLENPTTSCDGMGTLHSFSTKHSNFTSPADIFKDPHAPLVSPLLREYKDAVLLSYFEHGQCIWAPKEIMSERNTPDFRWDGVSLAGVWRPDKALVQELRGLKGSARQKKLLEFANQCCEVYTAWCNGEVYQWSCQAFDVKHADTGEAYDMLLDYRHATVVREESCGGYYGGDGLKETTSEIKHFLQERFPDNDVVVEVD